RGLRRSTGTPASSISPSGPTRPCRARSNVPSMTARLRPESAASLMRPLCPAVEATARGEAEVRSGAGALSGRGGRMFGDAHAQLLRERIHAVGLRAPRRVDDDLRAGAGVGEGVVVRELGEPGGG